MVIIGRKINRERHVIVGQMALVNLLSGFAMAACRCMCEWLMENS